jgi:hypothetical protein
MTIARITAEWFDKMPKHLKLLHIASNPECTSVMHHYRTWDVNALTFDDMMSSTQRRLMTAYRNRTPEAS